MSFRMKSSTRAPPPAPLYTTGPARAQVMASPTHYESTPRTAGSDASAFSRSCPRTDSMDSNASAGSAASHQSRKVSTPRNVYTHCGRHSDQYLFGGWGDVVKTVFHHKKH